MQYIDKEGNRHDIPLRSVQPKISPDSDNALYDSPNGLKVPKGGKVYGYLDPDDGLFYKEKTFVTKITPDEVHTYVDMTTHAMWKPYVWDELHSIYRSIGSGQGMGSATFVSMLQEQYDILPDDEKQDGSFAYFVEDANDGAEAIVVDMLAEKLSEEIARKVADTLYPIGSYAFGVMPSIGTWEEVEGDRALWLKDTVDDGTEIEQALPNIKSNGNIGVQNTSEAGFSLRDRGCLYVTGSSAYSVSANTGGAKTGQLAFNASRSNNIYKDGANVQPNAYVMKVFKRIA